MVDEDIKAINEREDARAAKAQRILAYLWQAFPSQGQQIVDAGFDDAELFGDDGPLSVWMDFPADAPRTPEEVELAKQVCASAIAYPYAAIGAVEVYDYEDETLLAACRLGDRSTTDVAAFLRANYANTSWYPLIDKVEEDHFGNGAVAIITVIPPNQVSADLGVPTEICRAALEAPGVTHVVVWPFGTDQPITQCP